MPKPRTKVYFMCRLSCCRWIRLGMVFTCWPSISVKYWNNISHRHFIHKNMPNNRAGPTTHSFRVRLVCSLATGRSRSMPTLQVSDGKSRLGLFDAPWTTGKIFQSFAFRSEKGYCRDSRQRILAGRTLPQRLNASRRCTRLHANRRFCPQLSSRISPNKGWCTQLS